MQAPGGLANAAGWCTCGVGAGAWSIEDVVLVRVRWLCLSLVQERAGVCAGPHLHNCCVDAADGGLPKDRV